MAHLRMLRILWVALAFSLGAVGCREVTIQGSNNLPIPPPAELLPKSAGVYEASGDVGVPAALVVIENMNTSLVFGQQSPAGAYQFEIEAQRGDCIALRYYTDDGWRSMIRVQTVEGADNRCQQVADAGP